MTYQLVLDVWEGNAEIDEPTLKAGGIAALIIRLNDMNGGHHMDENFTRQWNEAKTFLRAPYFVYNPWISGRQNYDWLAAHCPVAKLVFADIEVRYSGISAGSYADQVEVFLNLCKTRWDMAIYTGGGYTGLLTHWPTNVPYWWARYPGAWYPTYRTFIKYDALRAKADAQEWLPDPTNLCPVKPRLWQVSGDKYLLPGCGASAIDINLYPGSYAELEAWFGKTQDTTPPAPTLEERVAALELRVLKLEANA